MSYTMILVGTKLFMRGDEVMDLMHKSIDLSLSVITPDGVALTFQVRHPLKFSFENMTAVFKKGQKR